MRNKLIVSVLLLIILAWGLNNTQIQAQEERVVSSEAQNDCGPQALFALLHQFRTDVSLEETEWRSSKDSEGTTLLGLKKAAESYGFNAEGMRLTYTELQQELKKNLGVIAFVNQDHYVWVKAVDQHGVWYQDFVPGMQWVSVENWQRMWFEKNQGGLPLTNEGRGICLVVHGAKNK